ncbi:MAG: NAD(P)/FAD-dependent oxidoreductase [Ruminococcus sp.]|nr:NAD(P)/FAD-dependent oxidoreductase [Ruminococcus sp.]
MKKIAVIGGGASGLMAAVAAAQEGAQVCIFEHKDRIGKKLLSTGNGRCNFTNMSQEPIFYHSENTLFPWGIIKKFGVQQTVAFFLKLGIYSKNRNGYLYPQSDQASAVLDVLRMEVKRLGIQVKTDAKCKAIRPGGDGFVIDTEAGEFSAEKVILAAGSKAAPVSGSDGSGYLLAQKLGHRMIPVLPSLVQLKCKENFYKGIAGVRVEGRVSLYVDGECQAKDQGEIQITNYGISGIPVFQISRYAAIGLYENRQVTAVLNFLPDFTEEQFLAFLKNRIETRPRKTTEEFLTGLFHKKLSDLWVKLAHLERTKVMEDYTDEEIERLAHLIQNFSTEITGTNSFDQAQVCRGGIDTKEVCPNTLESLLAPGLYFAGEILDVDGICGGYNLQWAWSSGYTAGKEAAGA